MPIGIGRRAVELGHLRTTQNNNLKFNFVVNLKSFFNCSFICAARPDTDETVCPSLQVITINCSNRWQYLTEKLTVPFEARHSFRLNNFQIKNLYLMNEIEKL